MKTFNGKCANIHYNSDLSGDIIIFDKRTGTETAITKDDLLKFVAYHYIAPKRIYEIEQMRPEDLLK